MTSLSDQQIRDAFVAYDEGRAPGWTQWVDDATAHISWAQALTDAELADPEVQRQLWVTKGLGTVGSAENLSIAELPGDPELTGLYLKLRRGSLEPVPSPRARHVQALHDAMLARVQALLPGSTPRARLRRLLVSLRPAEGHSAFQDQAQNNVQRLLVGRSGLGAIEAGCLARARLREVLGDEADARAHAVRMTFCWWLHEQAEALTGGGAPGPVGAPGTGEGRATTPPPEAPTWTGEAIYQLWQSDAAQAAFCSGLAESTISTYRQSVHTVLSALRASHGDRAVDLEADVRDAVAQQWGRGATAQTVNGYRLKWNRWVGVANALGLPLRPLPTEVLGPTDRPQRPAPTLAELRALFETDPETAPLIFPPELLRGLFAAWSFHERKRFVLLSGLSGTGKTELLKHTARLTCAHMGLDPAEHVALVAVAPDWRDPTGLLGYPSALHATPTYHKTPALQLLLRAAEDPDRPYFLLLDEMNLARVERYFAPFLSAMESGAELHLHGEDGAVNGVPAKVPWPTNLRIGGTVNMDETTYPFSDKVLDRAFTFEFWQVDLDALFAKRGQDGPIEAPTQAALRALQAHLVPIRRHVGYRALTEVLAWVAACHEAEPNAPIAGLIDEAVFAKVLPRLRGSESSGLTAALSQIAATCGQHCLARCKEKVEAMAERLRDAGVTSFWS